MDKEKTIAVYAGSFDPFTNGHATILSKGLIIFDQVIILFANNPAKTRFIPLEEMMGWVQWELNNQRHRFSNLLGEIRVDSTDGFVAEWCKEHGGTHLIRGLRNPTDYAYEEEIAKVNRELNPELETVYLRADNDVISSSMVKTFIQQGKDVSKYVPKSMELRMKGWMKRNE